MHFSMVNVHTMIESTEEHNTVGEGKNKRELSGEGVCRMSFVQHYLVVVNRSLYEILTT